MRDEIDPWLILIQDKIRDDFGWKVSDDRRSLELLLKKIEDKNVEQWEKSNREKTLSRLTRLAQSTESRGITVVGAAAKSVELIPHILEDRMLVIADGSIGIVDELSSIYRKKALDTILFISSDCDGIPAILSPAISKNIFLLHAHGDNIESWDKFLEHWSDNSNTDRPSIVITHQLPEIIPSSINPGGFTDGDRAICSLLTMGIDKSSISLVGFSSDFVGKWSGITNNSVKLRKLKWMDEVLKHLGFMGV